MGISLTLLGTGTPAPLLHRGGSSYLVGLDGENLFFDCGPACVQRLLKKGVPPRAIDRLFLTHLHYDHCVDYGYLVLNRWDQGSGEISELEVCGPPPIAEMTEKLFGDGGVYDPDLDARTRHEGSEFIYEMRGGVLPRKRPKPAVTEVVHGETIEGGDWSVQVAEVIHVQPHLTCLAYRLNTRYQSIVFGGDTAPIQSLNDLADGADVLIHMCHFINGFVTDPRITGCCSGHLDAARTARDANVRTLVLTHITEQLEGPGIRERVVHEAGEIFEGNIIFGEDLLEVPLGDFEPAQIQ
jgi:ribonuclease BN (tRNA processing enzyme)